MAVPQPPGPSAGAPLLDRDTLHAVLADLRVGIVVTDTAGGILSLNAEALRIHGFASMAEMGPALGAYAERFELRLPDGGAVPFAEWPASRAVAGHYVRDYDVDLVRRDTGVRRRVRYGVVPLHDDAGRVAQLVFHVVDRTDEDLAARALAVVESRFERVFAHAATGIAITDWDGRFLECNAAYANLVGYTADELRRLTIPELIEPADRLENMRHIERLKRGEVISFEIENRYRRRDGTIVAVRKFVSLLPDASGQPAQLMALVTDVTERREAQERRRWEATRSDLLLRLLRDQRETADPADMMTAAAAGLGAVLGVARVGFFRVERDAVVRMVSWTDGSLPSIVGPIPKAALGETLIRRSQAGLATVIDDASRFDWTAEAVAALKGVGAVVVAPVRRSGDWYAGLYVHALAPREWQEREITLISEVAYQTWEGVERSTAQSALRFALDAAVAGIWTLDLASGAVTCDERLRTLFGFGPTERVTLETMSARLDAEDRAQLGTRLDAVHAPGGPDDWDMEVLIRRPDGSTAWARGIGRAERDASGRAFRLSGINLDVTATRRAALALQEVQDQQREHADTMRLLLEGAAQGILSIDPQGTILTANAALEAMFGWEAGSLPGESLAVLLPPAARQAHARHRAGYFAAPRSRPMGQGLDLLGMRRDGTTFPVEISLNHVSTAAGGRAIAFVTDITERRKASARLRDSEQRLRLALDAAEAGAWTWDLATDLVAADARTCLRLGLPVDEPFLPPRFQANIHPDDRAQFLAAMAAVRDPAGADGWNLEYRRTNPDGRVTWHQSIARRTRERDLVTRVAGISLDVTARKEAEAELARSHAALRMHTAELEARAAQLRRLVSDLTLAEQRAREQLAKTLHDGLQQLLFSAMLKIDVASRQSDDAELLQQARGDLEDAIGAARSLSVELFPPALRLGELPAALDWLAGWTRQKYGVRVDASIDPLANPAAEDVRLLLFESVRELLFNAVKHAGVESIELDATLDEDDQIEIGVADEGVGFDASHATGAGDLPRTGLGLFGIRERLTVVGGHMEIESAPGRGARFRLRVPRQRTDGAPAPAAAPSSAAEPSAGAPVLQAAITADSRASRRLRILLADDHADVRAGLRRVLAGQAALEVVGEASDGLDAIVQAEALRPDAIVMDVSMPRLDGIEATRRIHGAWPAIAVFGLSTQERPAGPHPIERAGASGYFTKGDDPARLVARLLALQAALGSG